MSFGIIGKKVGMTQVFTEDGTRHALTVVEAGPCVVLQKKTMEKDGYNALQLGFSSKAIQWKSTVQEKQGKMKGTRKKNSVPKPMVGHFEKAGKGAFRYLKEFRTDRIDDFEVGQEISMADFGHGDILKVTGTSKGRGFQGVVKRHGFHGGRKTHGSRSHRIPGSIGMCAWPARVLKNKKMPGQLGNAKVTIKNIFLFSVDEENNLMFLRGSIPGASNGIVYIQKQEG